MKQKLLKIKTLLVATALTMGVTSAWSITVTETYDFGSFITANGAPAMTLSTEKVATQSGTSTYTGGDLFQLGNLFSNGEELEFNNRFALDYGHNAAQKIRFTWRSSTNAYQHGLAGNWNSKGAANTACHLSILNMKSGDKVTITYAVRSGKDAQPYLCQSGVVTDVDADAYLASGTEYTIAADGNLDLYFKDNNFAISKIVIKTEEDAETMGNPTMSVKINGIYRIITVTPGIGNAGSEATATYYTTDGSDPTVSDTRILYTKPFEISTTSTVKVVSYLGEVASEVVSEDIEAGTSIKLNAPTIAQSSFTLFDEYYYRTFTFTSDQSNIMGKPNAKITYSFKGGDEIEASSFMAEEEGNLTVTVSADGYESNKTTIYIDLAGRFVKTYSFDATTEVTRNDGIEWGSGGDATNVNSTQWTFAAIDQVTFSMREDIRLNNFVYARATSADTNQGFYVRAGKGRINYSLNGAELIQFTMFGGTNIYANASTKSTEFAQYSNVRKIEVYTPAFISADVTDAGWATLYTPFPLDFSEPEEDGLTAYTATCDGETVTLTKVTNVPANTGVVLKGEEGTYYIPVIASSTTARGDLKGSTTEDTYIEAFEDEYYIYILGMNGENEAQFFRTGSGAVPSGKAYLLISQELEVRAMNVVINETTAIQTIAAEQTQTGIFTLSGQRVAKALTGNASGVGLKKGLYIENGKKVVVK